MARHGMARQGTAKRVTGRHRGSSPRHPLWQPTTTVAFSTCSAASATPPRSWSVGTPTRNAGTTCSASSTSSPSGGRDGRHPGDEPVEHGQPPHEDARVAGPRPDGRRRLVRAAVGLRQAVQVQTGVRAPVAAQVRAGDTVRLSDALDGVQLELYRHESGSWHARASAPTTPDKAAEIDAWGLLLAVWWRQSPSALRECDLCGSVALAGKGGKRRCWSCGRGTMTPLQPEFTRKRPRRKKVKIAP